MSQHSMPKVLNYTMQGTSYNSFDSLFSREKAAVFYITGLNKIQCLICPNENNRIQEKWML